MTKVALALFVGALCTASLDLSEVSAQEAAGRPTIAGLSEWTTDFGKAIVPLSEIQSGGPPKDGIPSIDEPQFEPAVQIDDVGESEPVMVLRHGGEVRAYPMQIMMYHEIVNDVVAGTPVAVTYCPLCNAAIVFDRRIDGEATTFGTTGRLRNSDLVMYDRATESWWQQFTGQAIVGRHAGKALKTLPSSTEAFGSFRKSNPSAQVLVPNDPSLRPYGRNPYVAYDTTSRPFLYRGNLPDDLPAMARVVVVPNANDEEPLIVALDALKDGRFQKNGVTIRQSGTVASALDDAAISNGRKLMQIAVERDGKPVVAHETFAFVAHAFHPDIPIMGRNRMEAPTSSVEHPSLRP
ncbi:DUF3179 domain-containing protein [Notoacmeibacter sp. MSK16QG-6]|uniref:DUF3179 domain-containing protein n=1 Tax=Notoacmeibacter sp. MSK16QG-6 TaxID=2957982 RepID=UPI0020A222B7|nr:DUF3179 domain-containing protein [Notoacmeibacter sp. MSK16QG-6]MCP1199478.1 DUF3179 domain-containing protein [Notoacmeibacter sp. MSK16QG-6]